jgi:hypothetical protein
LLKNKKMTKKTMKKKNGKKSSFGMLSVKAGIDKNPKPTAADRIAGATKGKKKMMGGGMMKKEPMAMGYKKGGSAKGTHVTKEGKTAKKGLWYNIHQKRKRGAKMRKPGAKGAPTAAALKRSQS